MARREKKISTVGRAKTAIARTAKKLTSKLRPGSRKRTEKQPIVAGASLRATPKVKTARAVVNPPRAQSRPAKRETDIPLDRVAKTYTPAQTSLKTPFRATGVEQQRSQEFVADRADERWGDEDHYTNKSGNPRIGTRGRTYEPGEKR